VISGWRRRGATIVTFRVDAGTGKLAATGQVIRRGSPSCIVFRKAAPSELASFRRSGISVAWGCLMRTGVEVSSGPTARRWQMGRLGNGLVVTLAFLTLVVGASLVEPSSYHALLRAGNYEVAADFQCNYVVEPDLDLAMFQSAKISDKNYARYNDPVLDDLYVKQARALDVEERRKHLRAFERRLLDEEAHYLTTLQQHRIIPHNAKVKGWTVTPSHYLNNQLDTVWLAE
jgi:ABC-type transport system substrate-binding protein